MCSSSLAIRDVILERVFVALRIEDVARVADGGFADLPFFRAASMATFMFGSQLSESKMRKMSMPCAAASTMNSADDVVRVVGVADGVRRAEEHLEADVRDGFAQALQALPGIFEQEPHRDVEGRAAPHFEGEEARQWCAK